MPNYFKDKTWIKHSSLFSSEKIIYIKVLNIEFPVILAFMLLQLYEQLINKEKLVFCYNILIYDYEFII